MSSPCDLSPDNLLLTKPEQIDGRRCRLRGSFPRSEVEKIVGVKKPFFDYLGESSKESRAAIEEKGSGASTKHEDKEAPEEKVFLSYIMFYGPGDANCGAPAIDQEDVEEMEKEEQVKIGEEFLIDGPFTAKYKVTAHERLQLFILQTPVGNSYICGEIWEGERNKIVLAVKAFREMNVVSVRVREVCWTKPPIGYLKLNTEGNYRGGTEYAVGGLIRDEFGGWVRGFWGRIQLPDGPFDMIMIKLMALEEGLTLAVELDPQAKYVIESSFVVILELLDPENRAALSENLVNQCNNLVTKCRLLLDDLPNCELRIIGIQGNEAAGFLAFACNTREFGVEKLDNPPTVECVINHLEKERTAVPSNMHLQIIEDFIPVEDFDSETDYPVRAPVFASKQMKVHPCVDFMDYLRKK